MTRLWDANNTAVDQAILTFTVGGDPVLDREILPYDCLGSAAHLEVLHAAGVVSEDEREALRAALAAAFELAAAGQLSISVEQEDGHTALEAFLTEKTGETGKKIHTGRSRNDQVITAVRLMVRERLIALSASVGQLVESLLVRGREHARTVMPGFTHTRQAMPSTAGQLFFSVAEGLVRDLESFDVAFRIANRCALGSASGYGVPLPLDRELAASSLGLDGPDVNTVYAQNTRGQLESAVVFAMHRLSLTLSRFAADLIAMSSEAFGFFALPVELTTGSSIMPQKRNPDALELVRATPSAMLARYSEITSLLQGLGGGYHRDLQRTKGPMLRALAEASACLAVTQRAAETLEVDAEVCAAALGDEIFATDRAFEHVRNGVPFRDAYRQVKEEGSEAIPTDDVLAGRDHLGAPGTDQAEQLRAALAQVQSEFSAFAAGAQRARELLGTELSLRTAE